MTEFETDPQRRPAATDAEPSHPSAEPSRVERGESDTTASPGGTASPGTTAAGTAGAPAGTSHPGSSYAPPSSPYAPPAASAYPQSSYQPAAASGDQAYRPGYPASTGYPQAGQYPSAGYPQPGQHQSGWAGGYPGQHRPGQPGAAAQSAGYPGSAVGGQPGAGYPGQPGAQSSGGYPGQPSAGYPGQPGPGGPQQPGQPAPPWASGPAPQAGRVAKFVGAGVAVFALMLGSGVAGGALALAVDGDGGGITRNYSAAPVINSADLPKIAASVQDSVVSIMTDSGEGSGVVLSSDGFVLTNNHVVASASGKTVRVVFANGQSAPAEIRGTDPKTDLAVVKTSGLDNLKAAKFGDSDAMQVGDQVLALGSPLGLQGSVTAGILSARDRTIQAGSGDSPQQAPQGGASSISGLLQTDAPINPGNSGGALVNTRGEVIGINTAIATAGQGSTGNIGVGFAIPSNKAKNVAEKLQRGEKVSHPSLGVSVNAAEDGGALVAAVTGGSAAEKAGIQRGDVITRFGDKVINDSNDLVGAVQAGKVGDRVQVTYKRNGTEATATVTLAETS
ncbi:trypsin-like peptidase domain-containing protein [Micromonospora antibiotica]|uniref:Trypsin-like peptidase domain-containing protein n=1 Tax=Micromonospora antibiotica TaxID=2807623 RepID=A0ABS3VAW5_9ACTN|nr:trypsin-like peptidase domain-containing protein [Micromonospora antibiotica]MBO4162761.1 trypsin-like peptidase domain-containing protein [Micromonospora antibiotica]